MSNLLLSIYVVVMSCICLFSASFAIRHTIKLIKGDYS